MCMWGGGFGEVTIVAGFVENVVIAYVPSGFWNNV